MTFTAAASRRVFSIWDAGGNDTIDASVLRHPQPLI